MAKKRLKDGRIKTSMEIVPETFEMMKARASERQIPLWRATQDALDAYLKITPESPIPRHLWKYPDKLRDLLASGDEMVIEAVTRSIDVYHDRLRVATDHKGR